MEYSMIGLVIASFVSTTIPVVCCIFNEDSYHVSIHPSVYMLRRNVGLNQLDAGWQGLIFC